MQKAKVFNIVGSNIEALGSELERSCKETAAATEAQVITYLPPTLALEALGRRALPLHTHGRPRLAR
jgi:hypothetical protein